jgi:hypothetical protein
LTAALDQKRFYVCAQSHPNDRIYAANVTDYFSTLGIPCSVIYPSHGRWLGQCLSDTTLAVLGFNSHLDHAWINGQNFLHAAEAAQVPVIHWILDHPSTRWPEFNYATEANSAFLFVSQGSERYFRLYGLPNCRTGATVGVGPSYHSRVSALTREGFWDRQINCIIPMNLRRVGGSLDEIRARISMLGAPLTSAVHAAIEAAKFDLIQPLEEHLVEALSHAALRIDIGAFHKCLQMVEGVVQIFRRSLIFKVAREYPVVIQSDDLPGCFARDAVAKFETNVLMKSTLAKMRSTRSVLSVSNTPDMLHDRTLNGLNAGAVNIIEDNASHRRYFTHRRNALLFRYDDDSLRECLSLVCSRSEELYEIAAAGMAMRDNEPFRFGGFHNMISLACTPAPHRARIQMHQ